MSYHPADEFARLCIEHERIPDVFQFLNDQADLSNRDVLDVLLVDQFQRWKHQQAIPVDLYLTRTPQLNDVEKVELLIEEFGYLEQRGVAPDSVEFVKRFQNLHPDALAQLREELDVESTDSQSSGSNISGPSHDHNIPKSLGRYELIRVIGQGSFGDVYLARDPDLQRNVAIKVPTAKRIELGGGSAEFIQEARAVAGLDHPNIVPVYDCGQLDNGTCFVVSKFIKGKPLRSEIRKTISQIEAVKIAATMALALHSAHRSGLVHRDVKPGNILIDSDRQPHLLDFGLALRDQDLRNTDTIVGTPAYMSPEQASGSEQSVDGRSDIYSLGVVLYEMLTHRRPVSTVNSNEIIQQVALGEVRPPRQLNDNISPELERICMKALARKVSERYSTAKDFAIDLHQFLDDQYPETAHDSTSRSSWKRPTPTSKSGGNLRWAFSIATMVAAAMVFVYLKNSGNFSLASNQPTIDLQPVQPIEQGKISLTGEFPPRLAVLSFRSVAGQEDSRWLRYGLAELLTAELEKSADLEVLARQSVNLLETDLQLFETDSLPDSTMENIGNRIGTDLVVTGSFEPAGADLSKFLIRFHLQNARDGQTISSFSDSVELENWGQLIQRAAAQFRGELGLQPLDVMQTGQTNIAMPTAIDAARHYYCGIDAMRNFDLPAAKQDLIQAARLAPNSAVILDSVADVLTQLGDEKLAREYSQRAVQLTANLPRLPYWRITARNHLLQGRPSQAVAVYREIFEQNPSITPAIELAQALIRAGQGRQAAEMLTPLREEKLHPSEAANVLLTSANAAEATSNYPEQLEMANQALRLADEIGSELIQAQGFLQQGRALFRQGDPGAAKKLLQAFELFEQFHDHQGAAVAMATLAKTYIDAGDFDTAQEKTEQAIELIRPTGNERLLYGFYGQLGELLIYRGKFDEAKTKLHDALDRFTALGDPHNAAGIGLTLANLTARLGNAEEAHRMIREARQNFQAAGNRQAEARTWGQQGAMYGRAGDSDQAHTHFLRALELFREVGDRRSEATCLGDVALTFSTKGDYQKAGEYLSKSLELHRQLGSQGGPARVSYNLGLLYIRTGRPRDALPLLLEAYNSFESRGNLMDACFVQRKLGDLLLRFGELQRAKKELNSALKTAKTAGSKKSVEASALAAQAVIKIYESDLPSAIQLLEESRAIRVQLKQDGNIAATDLALAEIAERENRLDEAAELLRRSKGMLAITGQGWQWIYRAAIARVDAKRAKSDDTLENDSEKTLRQFEIYLNDYDSQDVNMKLSLDLEYARLLAAIGEPNADKAYLTVIEDAREQELLATAFEAETEFLEFQKSRSAKIDSSHVAKLAAQCQEMGFLDLANRLNAIVGELTVSNQ